MAENVLDSLGLETLTSGVIHREIFTVTEPLRHFCMPRG